MTTTSLGVQRMYEMFLGDDMLLGDDMYSSEYYSVFMKVTLFHSKGMPVISSVT